MSILRKRIVLIPGVLVGAYILLLSALLLSGSLGNIYSQNLLGAMFYRGYGVPKSLQTAIFWYEKGVSMGSPHAKYSLGALYFNGEGVPQDNVKALALFKESADEGVSLAQSFTGQILYQFAEKPHQKRILAYKYLALAQQNGESVEDLVSKVKSEMSNIELLEAEQLIAEHRENLVNK